MNNQSRSLFDLEGVVVPRFIPRRPVSFAGRKRRRRRPQISETPATAYSFDTGSPIRCEHTLPERPVERVGVTPEREVEPLPVQSQAYDLHVEAFDEPDEDTGISIPWNNDEEDVAAVSVQRSIPSTSEGGAESVWPIDYDQNGLTDFLVLNGARGEAPVQLIAFFPAS